MPLIITAIFFAFVFAGEGLYFLTKKELEDRALRRYERCEHSRRKRSDTYLDWM